MDLNQILMRSYEVAKKAVEKDTAGEYEEAFELYKTALNNFHFVRKNHSVDALKNKLYEKMSSFMNRAEEIKEYLKKNPNKIVEHSQLADTCPKKIKSNDDYIDTLKDQLEGAIITEKPNIYWSDIAGLQQAKASLQEAVIFPTRFPSLFVGDRKPWRGILLYGPPGTGKTFLAKACATESDATFLSVSSSDLMSKWQGESEKLVKNLFEMARKKDMSIIFIDEVDSLCSARTSNESDSSRRVKTQFLIQMQGLGNDNKGTLVLGATNVPWELDPAIRRRFERRIYIPLPDLEGRKHMFHLAVSRTPHNMTDEDFNILAEKTEGFSGADISIAARDALFQPVRKCRTATHFKEVVKDNTVFFTPCSPDDPDPTKKMMSIMSIKADYLFPPQVSSQDFLDIIETARPSVGPEDLVKYVEWTKEFGQEGN